MRLRRVSASLGLAGLAALTSVSPARASDIGPDGRLVFAKDALKTYDFESPADVVAEAQWIVWANNGSLGRSAVTLDNWASSVVTGANALEGESALSVVSGPFQGLALIDAPFFKSLAAQRIVVRMWGRALGAEPALEVRYTNSVVSLGPDSFAHVFAIRTGRETSDGWVEYSTGPIDGSIWGIPISAILLTARYATDQGTSLLIGGELTPGWSGAPKLEDPTGTAVIDAVEIAPSPASPSAMDSSPCTIATADAVCGSRGECVYGHCVDAAVVWGPAPEASDHRRDLAARSAFQMQHLISDRKAASTAATLFAGAADTLAAATTPRAYYGKLNQLIATVRDSHTRLGDPPSSYSRFYPFPDRGSGPLDVCFGLATQDLAPGSSNVYAVFAVGGGGSIGEKIQRGDVLTKIDGLAPDAWIAAITGLQVNLPNDSAADPSANAVILSKMIGRAASTITLTRCVLGSGCADLPPIPVASEIFQTIQKSGGSWYGNSIACTQRFHDAVTTPPQDGGDDTVAVETVGGITAIEFNGFEGAYDNQKANPYAAWEDPWTMAFTNTPQALVDARQGHGGAYFLGKWLFELLRGTAEPYGMFAMPRGGYDDPDPAWLFDASWDACMFPSFVTDKCDWAGQNTFFTSAVAPPGMATKIAWVNSEDVSMNDIVPRLLQGRSNFRVFGPHPTRGAYGEVSELPPIESTWFEGSMQVLDTRFGHTPPDARAAAWESGKGVMPDQIVVQTVSDILKDQDTLLNAARTWLSQ